MKELKNNTTNEIKKQEENNNMKNTMKEMIIAEVNEIKNEELRNLTIRVRTQRAIDALHDQWNHVCMHIDDVSEEEMSEEYAEFIRKINYADRLISNASGQGELTDIDYGRNIYKKQVRTHRNSEDIHIQQFISEWDRTENEIAEIRAEIQELRDMWKAAGGYDLCEQRYADEQALAEIDLDTEDWRDADTEKAERESLEAGWAELIAMERQMQEQEEEEEKQEEKEMTKYNKQQDVIDRVISTYEVVGREDTINNCKGLDDDNKTEFLERTDVTVMAAEYIFGCSDAEAEENEKLLVSYYESLPEESFVDWTDDDIISERLVTRMAKDLLDAKAQAPELDAVDRWRLSISDTYAVKLYRAEFLHTYKQLDIRDDVMENYLTNFLSHASTWNDMMRNTSGWRWLIKKIHGYDGKFFATVEDEEDIPTCNYSWSSYVTDMTAWLRDIMEIAIVCGTYSPDNSYRVITHTNREEFLQEVLDVKNSIEEKIHTFETRNEEHYESVRFEYTVDFAIKLCYEIPAEPQGATDLSMSALRLAYSQYVMWERWQEEGIGHWIGYYRAA